MDSSGKLNFNVTHDLHLLEKVEHLFHLKDGSHKAFNNRYLMHATTTIATTIIV